MKHVRINIVVCAILILSIIFSSPQARASGGGWGESILAAYLKQQLEVIQRQIEGVLLGSLKMTAMNMLNSQIGQLIGGGAGGAPRFITNWESSLYIDPERNAQLYMNDFFTRTTRGMGSTANYVRMGVDLTSFTDRGSGSQRLAGSGGTHLNNPVAINDAFALRAEGMMSPVRFGSIPDMNYAKYLEQIGRAAISGSGAGTITLNEYTPSPEAMFRNGDWRAFDAFISNPMNNPYGYSIAAEQTYQAKLEREREIARTQAIAYQGYKGSGSGQNITTPGSTIKSLVDSANDFGNKIIAGATNPAELLGSLASAAVNKAINGLVQKGIGEVQSQINRQIGAVNNQARSIVNEATNAVGPGARFLPEIQRGISINPDFSRAQSLPPLP